MVVGSVGGREKGTSTGTSAASPSSPPDAVTGFVYLVTNGLSGKEYVGQTCTSLERRWIQHRSEASTGSLYALHSAMRKYGFQSFSIVMLEEVRGGRDALLAAEVRQIATRGTVAPNGYNLTNGGEGVDFSNPTVQENHRRAVEKSSASESWRQAQFAGAQKRLADPEWRKNNAEATREAHTRPEYIQQATTRWREFFASPEGRERHGAGIARRSEGAWKENHRAAMVRMHQDPSYIAKRDAALKRGAEKRTREAEERDKAYPPEIAAKRVQAREAYCRRAAARRAKVAQ